MDLGFLVFSVFVMMISPLGDVRCSAGDAIDCPCPAIPPVDLTQPPPETCFKIDSRFRYSCTEGYVRKAGTSNLIKCQNTDTGGVAKWTVPTLQCIPDPNIIQMPPPSPAVKQVHTDIPPDSTIATTVTAATTVLQMTQSISTSASVTAETDSTEPTSSGLQVLSVHTQAGTVVVTETKTTAGMTPASTTAVPSLWSTVEPQRHELTSTAAKISIGTLVIICACAGLSFYYYKRRTKNMIPVRTSEEDVPMSCSQPATAAESSRMNGDQDCGV
uniref:Sushi domain-containing protein n=1 Tax=Sparus aurata TaxID=8175 RepID=A0A671XDJ9_SPAAU